MRHDNEKERQDLRRERGKAMTDGLMKHWKNTPRSVAEMYADRCLAADPLTERYFKLVEKLRSFEEVTISGAVLSPDELKTLLDRRHDDVAAQNYRAAGTCRRQDG